MVNYTYTFQMNLQNLPKHIVQSFQWGEFKKSTGKKVVKVGEVQFSLHKLPLLPYYIGYCPKVDPSKIDWEEIKQAGKQHNCVAIRFDCPNVIKGVDISVGMLQDHTFSSSGCMGCPSSSACSSGDVPPSQPEGSQQAFPLWRSDLVPSPRNTFATHTIFLDISQTEDELLAGMSSKTRYNVRYAEKHSIRVAEESNQKGLENFLKLQRQTATRQGFYIHPDSYYRKVWETLHPENMVHILTAYSRGDSEPVVSWMLFSYKGVLYYPYGGSSLKHRNLFPSQAVMWAAIKLGKRFGCTLFDMWGATSDKKDEWWGFTRFKLGFGGELVEFEDSMDLVINKPIYKAFVFSYKMFWKLVDLKKSLTSFFGKFT